MVVWGAVGGMCGAEARVGVVQRAGCGSRPTSLALSTLRCCTHRHPAIYPPVLLDAKIFGLGSELEAKVEGALDLSEMKPRYFTRLPPQCKLNCTHLTLPASVVTLGEYASETVSGLSM